MLTSAAEGAGLEILHGGGGMSCADVSSRGERGGFGNTARGRGYEPC